MNILEIESGVYSFTWEQIEDKSFDSKGVLRFEVTADDMKEYKDCLIVVLLER